VKKELFGHNPEDPGMMSHLYGMMDLIVVLPTGESVRMAVEKK